MVLRPPLRSIANDGDSPKERSNRPLLRSLSGAAERLLRVFRLVLLSWISSSTSSWLLQGRRCANSCHHTKMRLPSAQAGSACCVRHCCVSKTRLASAQAGAACHASARIGDPNSAGAADVRLAKVHMKFPSAKIIIHTAFVHCHEKKIKPGAHVQVNPCLAHLHEKCHELVSMKKLLLGIVGETAFNALHSQRQPCDNATVWGCI